MPESVACPSCRSEVAVPAEHNEPSIRCGICWADVPLANRASPPRVEPSPPPSPPAIAVARRPAAVLPGKPLPGMAKLEERLQRAAAKIAPPPAPVVAKPVVAAAIAVSKPAVALVEIQPLVAPVPVRVSLATDDPPVAELVSEEPPERPSRPSRSPSSRRRYQREEDEDDYDDRPRRRPSKTKGQSPLPLIVGIGAFVLLLAGGVYLIARATRGTSDRDPVPVAEGDPAMQFNLPNPDGNPPVGGAQPPAAFGFNPFPRLPNMQPPGANLALVAHAGDGYTAKVFARPLEHPSILNLYDDNFIIAHARTKNLSSTSAPPSAIIEITTADVPQGVTPDMKRIVADLAFRRGEAKDAKLAGHDGLEHVDDFAGRNTTTRIVRVGCRIFLAKFTIIDAFGDRRSAETARKDFFDSFKITFDPDTPAPVEPGLIPRQPIRPPKLPTPPRPKRPGQP